MCLLMSEYDKKSLLQNGHLKTVLPSGSTVGLQIFSLSTGVLTIGSLKIEIKPHYL
jgi:hypothetical protein